MAEEDEGTLLLAHAEVNGSDTLSTLNLIQTEVEAAKLVAVTHRWPLITSSAPKRRIRLVEKEVYAVLGDGERETPSDGSSTRGPPTT
jgi:hypothetical protein